MARADLGGGGPPRGRDLLLPLILPPPPPPLPRPFLLATQGSGLQRRKRWPRVGSSVAGHPHPHDGRRAGGTAAHVHELSPAGCLRRGCHPDAASSHREACWEGGRTLKNMNPMYSGLAILVAKLMVTSLFTRQVPSLKCRYRHQMYPSTGDISASFSALTKKWVSRLSFKPFFVSQNFRYHSNLFLASSSIFSDIDTNSSLDISDNDEHGCQSDRSWKF